MCFTPGVSLFVFFIEAILAVIVFLKNPKKRLNQITSLIFLLLGLYQLSEYLLCSYSNQLFWAHASRVFYAFLPALAIHWAYLLTNGKKSICWIYIAPIIAVLFEILNPGFIISAECRNCFISITEMQDPYHFYLYCIYYFGFILAAMIMLFRAIEKSGKRQRKILSYGFAAFLSCSLPALILWIILPRLHVVFPSLYCEFALLFSLLAYYTVTLREKAR